MAADIYTVDESSLSHRILGIGFFDMKFVRETSPKKKEEKTASGPLAIAGAR